LETDHPEETGDPESPGHKTSRDFDWFHASVSSPEKKNHTHTHTSGKDRWATKKSDRFFLLNQKHGLFH